MQDWNLTTLALTTDDSENSDDSDLFVQGEDQVGEGIAPYLFFWPFCLAIGPPL